MLSLICSFNNPKTQASLATNTFAITGQNQVKSITEMLPSILSQLGSDGLNQLKKLAASSTADPTVVDDDEVPELTTDFEETAVESLTQKVQEIPVA